MRSIILPIPARRPRCEERVGCPTEAAEPLSRLTQTYGNAYAQTQEYADKLAALQQTQGEERLVLEQTLHDRQMQQDVANAQHDAGFVTRRLNTLAQVSGNPGGTTTASALTSVSIPISNGVQGTINLPASASARQSASQTPTIASAAISALAARQKAEFDSLVVSLQSTYGDLYATTKRYSDKLNALSDAQAAEMQLAIAQINQASLEHRLPANSRCVLRCALRQCSRHVSVARKKTDAARAAVDASPANSRTSISADLDLRRCLSQPQSITPTRWRRCRRHRTKNGSCWSNNWLTKKSL